MIITEQAPANRPIRQLTICNKHFARQGAHRGHVVFPIINLCGKWLQDMGFESGQVITVECRHRQLVIRTDGRRKYASDQEQ